MTRTLQFFVAGVPIPKGSTKSFAIKSKKTGKYRAVTTAANNKTKPWQQEIAFAAAREKQLSKVRDLWGGPITLTIHFGMKKPVRHPKRHSIPHITKPDLDKLERTVLDALTDVVYFDDAQVNEVHKRKEYSDKPGITLTIERKGGEVFEV